MYTAMDNLCTSVSSCKLVVFPWPWLPGYKGAGHPWVGSKAGRQIVGEEG